MIKEDYVSFETSKLLKEKGFNEDSWFHYDADCHIVTRGYRLNMPEDIPAWTLQMAMKWLRNQHNLHIMVDCIGSKNYMPTIQFTCNGRDIKVESDKNKIGENGFDSFEEACETAIKYCLEKLI